MAAKKKGPKSEAVLSAMARTLGHAAGKLTAATKNLLGQNPSAGSEEVAGETATGTLSAPEKISKRTPAAKSRRNRTGRAPKKSLNSSASSKSSVLSRSRKRR